MLGHSFWVRNRSITSRSEVCTQVMKKTQLSLQSSTCKNNLYWFVEYLSIRFPPAATSFILQQFSQYGNIVRSVVSLPFLSLTKTIMHAWFRDFSQPPSFYNIRLCKNGKCFLLLKANFWMHAQLLQDAFSSTLRRHGLILVWFQTNATDLRGYMIQELSLES